MWIAGHQGILGKEEADRLAKEGAVEVHQISLLLYILV
jgi:ribonuclease HI